MKSRFCGRPATTAMTLLRRVTSWRAAEFGT